MIALQPSYSGARMRGIGEGRKHLETLRARAALAGVTLTDIEDDRGRPAYVVSRWGGVLTRQFGALADVERWLDEVAAARGPIGEVG